ncbi:MAG: Activator of Hsp90 ATPase 1 family protein [Actinomycetia bacterium]|nr:Activator of Hsp90 ATPase 1 family protein [Actinomycetes bacterium]
MGHTQAVSFELHVEYVFNAPPEVVFDAFTDTNAQKEWWGLEPVDPVAAESHLWVGGSWNTVWGQPGEEFRDESVFQAVERPHHLAIASTLTGPDGAVLNTETETRFEEEDGKTRLTVVATGYPTALVRDMFQNGLLKALALLDERVVQKRT